MVNSVSPEDLIGEHRFEHPGRVTSSVDLRTLEDHPAGRLVNRACHSQPFRSRQRADLGAQFDLPRTLVTLGTGTSDTSWTRSIHSGYRPRSSTSSNTSFDAARSSTVRSIFIVARESSACRTAASGHVSGRSAVRNARASNGLCADSRPSRSSASSKLGVHAPGSPSTPAACRRRAPAPRPTAPATTPAHRRSSGAVRRSRRWPSTGAERWRSDPRRRARRAEQMKIGIAPVVERPPTGHHHRVGVTSTQHAAGAGIIVGEHVEPEHQILCEHPVGDRRQIGASGASAQAFHQRRHYSGRGLGPVDPGVFGVTPYDNAPRGARDAS